MAYRCRNHWIRFRLGRSLCRLCQLLQLCEQFPSALTPPFVFTEFLRCGCSLTQKLGLLIQKSHQFVADLGAAPTHEPPPRKPTRNNASQREQRNAPPFRQQRGTTL